MNTRLATIQRNRAALLARAEQQRREVREVFTAWSGPISLVDRALSLYQRLLVSPMLIPAAAMALLWLRRRQQWAWVGPLMTVWRVFSSFRRQRGDRRTTAH